ncbi:serine-rich adhesin for platelets-like [Ptychodera flava]|uniref:serine-rich adhesin for platelets-like n=1 Tax=Ptychodera flava TaxID=63121 RepID=UPI00396AA7E4
MEDSSRFRFRHPYARRRTGNSGMQYGASSLGYDSLLHRSNAIHANMMSDSTMDTSSDEEVDEPLDFSIRSSNSDANNSNEMQPLDYSCQRLLTSETQDYVYNSGRSQELILNATLRDLNVNSNLPTYPPILSKPGCSTSREREPVDESDTDGRESDGSFSSQGADNNPKQSELICRQCRDTDPQHLYITVTCGHVRCHRCIVRWSQCSCFVDEEDYNSEEPDTQPGIRIKQEPPDLSDIDERLDGNPVTMADMGVQTSAASVTDVAMPTVTPETETVLNIKQEPLEAPDFNDLASHTDFTPPDEVRRGATDVGMSSGVGLGERSQLGVNIQLRDIRSHGLVDVGVGTESIATVDVGVDTEAIVKAETATETDDIAMHSCNFASMATNRTRTNVTTRNCTLLTNSTGASDAVEKVDIGVGTTQSVVTMDTCLGGSPVTLFLTNIDENSDDLQASASHALFVDVKDVTVSTTEIGVDTDDLGAETDSVTEFVDVAINTYISSVTPGINVCVDTEGLVEPVMTADVASGFDTAIDYVDVATSMNVVQANVCVDTDDLIEPVVCVDMATGTDVVDHVDVATDTNILQTDVCIDTDDLVDPVITVDIATATDVLEYTDVATDTEISQTDVCVDTDDLIEPVITTDTASGIDVALEYNDVATNTKILQNEVCVDTTDLTITVDAASGIDMALEYTDVGTNTKILQNQVCVDTNDLMITVDTASGIDMALEYTDVATNTKILQNEVCVDTTGLTITADAASGIDMALEYTDVATNTKILQNEVCVDTTGLTITADAASGIDMALEYTDVATNTKILQKEVCVDTTGLRITTDAASGIDMALEYTDVATNTKILQNEACVDTTGLTITVNRASGIDNAMDYIDAATNTKVLQNDVSIDTDGLVEPVVTIDTAAGFDTALEYIDVSTNTKILQNEVCVDTADLVDPVITVDTAAGTDALNFANVATNTKILQTDVCIDTQDLIEPAVTVDTATGRDSALEYVSVGINTKVLQFSVSVDTDDLVEPAASMVTVDMATGIDAQAHRDIATNTQVSLNNKSVDSGDLRRSNVPKVANSIATDTAENAHAGSEITQSDNVVIVKNATHCTLESTSEQFVDKSLPRVDDNMLYLSEREEIVSTCQEEQTSPSSAMAGRRELFHAESSSEAVHLEVSSSQQRESTPGPANLDHRLPSNQSEDETFSRTKNTDIQVTNPSKESITVSRLSNIATVSGNASIPDANCVEVSGDDSSHTDVHTADTASSENTHKVVSNQVEKVSTEISSIDSNTEGASVTETVDVSSTEHQHRAECPTEDQNLGLSDSESPLTILKSAQNNSHTQTCQEGVTSTEKPNIERTYAASSLLKLLLNKTTTHRTQSASTETHSGTLDTRTCDEDTSGDEAVSLVVSHDDKSGDPHDNSGLTSSCENSTANEETCGLASTSSQDKEQNCSTKKRKRKSTMGKVKRAKRIKTNGLPGEDMMEKTLARMDSDHVDSREKTRTTSKNTPDFRKDVTYRHNIALVRAFLLVHYKNTPLKTSKVRRSVMLAEFDKYCDRHGFKNDLTVDNNVMTYAAQTTFRDCTYRGKFKYFTGIEKASPTSILSLFKPGTVLDIEDFETATIDFLARNYEPCQGSVITSDFIMEHFLRECKVRKLELKSPLNNENYLRKEMGLNQCAVSFVNCKYDVSLAMVHGIRMKQDDDPEFKAISRKKGKNPKKRPGSVEIAAKKKGPAVQPCVEEAALDHVERSTDGKVIITKGKVYEVLFRAFMMVNYECTELPEDRVDLDSVENAFRSECDTSGRHRFPMTILHKLRLMGIIMCRYPRCQYDQGGFAKLKMTSPINIMLKVNKIKVSVLDFLAVISHYLSQRIQGGTVDFILVTNIVTSFKEYCEGYDFRIPKPYNQDETLKRITGQICKALFKRCTFDENLFIVYGVSRKCVYQDKADDDSDILELLS